MLKLLATVMLCLSQPAPKADDYVTATQPAIAPTSWELRFRFQDPKRIAVDVPGQKEPVVYWYMLYTIENPGKEEVEYYPEFDLMTDTLKVVHSEVRVSAEAFKAIQRRADDPFLLTPEKITGKIQRGEDRKKHGVAVFRDFDPKAKAFTIYVTGLSGEFKRIKNPGFDKEAKESSENPRYVLLRKTLGIPYKFPGGASTRDRAVPDRVIDGLKWVMR